MNRNREEYIKQFQDSFAKTIATIMRIPEDLPIESANGICVTFHEIRYAHLKDMLHALRESFGNYEMKYYFETCGTLSIRYTFDGLDVHFHCSDLENALEKIGKGKCKLETFDTTETRVVCAV